MGGSSGRAQIGVYCASQWEQSTVVAWMRTSGYAAALVTPATPAALLPPVIVVGARCAGEAASLAEETDAQIVVVGATSPAVALPGEVHVVPDGPGVAEDLQALLAALLGAQSGRIAMTDREREVLTTYALGATVDECAERHFVAASTVRTHYRRVVQRYHDAGRPVANKTQLLLRMLADGWIDLEPTLEPTLESPSSDPDTGSTRRNVA